MKRTIPQTGNLEVLQMLADHVVYEPNIEVSIDKRHPDNPLVYLDVHRLDQSSVKSFNE